jgi:hypothetical protein
MDHAVAGLRSRGRQVRMRQFRGQARFQILVLTLRQHFALSSLGFAFVTVTLERESKCNGDVMLPSLELQLREINIVFANN